MKKITILVFSILIFSSAFSQKIKIGFIGGSNFSYLTTDSSSIPMRYMKPGVKIGMIYEINNGYKSWISISPQLSQQGALFKYQSFSVDTATMYTIKYTKMIKNNLYYLKVPITWKQQWGDIYTKLGLFGSFKAFSTSDWYKIKEYRDGIDTTKGKYNSFSTLTRPIDIGVDFGFGTQIMINDEVEFFTEIGYSLGFLSINPKEIIAENKMYNRVYSISIGFIFGKKRYRYYK